MIVIFVAFLALVSGGSLLMKDREFSPNENRYLAEPPRLTVDNILSGKFQDGLENYLRDQICFRDGWITVKTGIQKACKDTDIGGAYVGKDGYDFEKITPEDVDEKQIDRNVKAVQDFFAKASENVEKDRISFLLVPSSGLVMADKLPAHARLFDQAKYIDQIEKQMKDCRVTDVREKLLSHNEDYIYYKTDHHWTSEGAYLAYETWCDSTGMESTPLADLKKQVATKKFRGSLYSKILDADSAYDSIWTYGDTKQKAYGSDCSLTIDEKKQTDSCYDTAQLSQKDKYKYFFGDNYGTVQIVSDHARHQDRNLLVIKDSFANTFVPFATENYGQKAYGSDCSLTIDEKKQTDSCYDTAQLSQKDKYKYFFGDNYGTVQIVSDHARHQDRNLLVIKDSFANTFVPFATENYGQITMIDLRYYNGNIEEYMKEHKITDVLVLYNITNFISDRNLYKLVGRI